MPCCHAQPSFSLCGPLATGTRHSATCSASTATRGWRATSAGSGFTSLARCRSRRRGSLRRVGHGRAGSAERRPKRIPPSPRRTSGPADVGVDRRCVTCRGMSACDDQAALPRELAQPRRHLLARRDHLHVAELADVEVDAPHPGASDEDVGGALDEAPAHGHPLAMVRVTTRLDEGLVHRRSRPTAQRQDVHHAAGEPAPISVARAHRSRPVACTATRLLPEPTASPRFARETASEPIVRSASSALGASYPRVHTATTNAPGPGSPTNATS